MGGMKTGWEGKDALGAGRGGRESGRAGGAGAGSGDGRGANAGAGTGRRGGREDGERERGKWTRGERGGGGSAVSCGIARVVDWSNIKGWRKVVRQGTTLLCQKTTWEARSRATESVPPPCSTSYPWTLSDWRAHAPFLWVGVSACCPCSPGSPPYPPSPPHAPAPPHDHHPHPLCPRPHPGPAPHYPPPPPPHRDVRFCDAHGLAHGDAARIAGHYGATLCTDGQVAAVDV
jgi:hypothetical protein